ncbi:MAG: 3-oxoacyl-ACP reductase [Planctomycetota bacterium]|nr:MAG: 3-oxoacyl-ACP reductase [Planctomycetota bacterium]
MELGLSDKNVLITGASGGIGRALASAFGGEGCGLVLHAHRGGEGLRTWLAEQAFAARTEVLEADLREPAALDEGLARARERLGRIDIAVANAGLWPVDDVPIHRMDPDRLTNTVGVNLLGATYTAAAFLRGLASAGPRPDGHGASLVFIGSTAGAVGESGHGDYALAKAGLVGLAQTLKHEIVDLDPYGRVNVVQPGWTVTHMVRPALSVPGVVSRVVATMPLRQLARAADIARSVLCLSSPLASRHTSGQVLTVAGGMEGRLRWTPEQVDEDAVRARLADD